jgi:predicted dehydrogenase
VNWWLAADPVEVSAYGALNVYGKNGTFRGTNCRTCPHKAKCPFYWDMTKDARLMKLYAECEDVDGYYRDGCVFREDVDIYDTMSAVVKYSTGVSMSYSLNASMPIEGYRIAFNGTKGRLEVRDYERQPWKVEKESTAFLTRNFGKHEELDMPQTEGGHGGGDDRLRDVIFKNAQVADYLKLPSARAGAMSCMTGIAARTSIEQNRPVKISDLVRL